MPWITRLGISGIWASAARLATGGGESADQSQFRVSLLVSRYPALSWACQIGVARKVGRSQFVPLFAQSFAKKTRPVLLLRKIRLRRCGWFGQWTVGLRLNGSMAETGSQGTGLRLGLSAVGKKGGLTGDLS